MPAKVHFDRTTFSDIKALETTLWEIPCIRGGKKKKTKKTKNQNKNKGLFGSKAEKPNYYICEVFNEYGGSNINTSFQYAGKYFEIFI